MYVRMHIRQRSAADGRSWRSIMEVLAKSAALWIVSVVLLIVAAATATLALLTAYLCYTYRKYAHLPSPARPSFFLGHIPDLKGDNHPFHKIYYKWYEEAGPIFVVFFIVEVVVVTVNPDDVKELFMNPAYGKPHRIYKHFQTVCGERALGTGLLSETEYEVWKPRRKLYDPIFHKRYLKGQVFKFNHCIDQLIKRLSVHADGQSLVLMKDYIHDVTTDIISQFAFSEDVSQRWTDKNLGVKKSSVNEKLHYLTSHVLGGIQRTLRNPFVFEYLHPFEAESYREAVRALRKIGRDAILRRVGTLEEQEAAPSDILSCILKVSTLKGKTDIEDLVDDFSTFYTAGQETTANMLCFALVLIHLHPEVLDKVRSEVEEVLAGKEHISNHDLERLQYMEQVFMETLRLCPPLSCFMKTPPKGGICLSGYSIPEGTLISMAGAVMCRMPQYYDHPDSFCPSRFDPENKRKCPFVFFPFGLGHRSCIARNFAMMEAKAVLARLLQQFKFTLPSGYRLIPVTRGVLQTQDGIPCTLQPLHSK